MKLSKLKQNKKLLAIVGVVLIVVIGLVGFLMISSKSKPADFSNPNGDTSVAPVASITAKELGLVITVRPDNLAVKFKINNSSDIEHVDYQITYQHSLEGETVEEGVTGEMNIGTDGITTTDYRPFGTCSSGVCRYDKDVSNVKLIMKIEKKDGKVYSLEADIPLNSTEDE